MEDNIVNYLFIKTTKIPAATSDKYAPKTKGTAVPNDVQSTPAILAPRLSCLDSIADFIVFVLEYNFCHDAYNCQRKPGP